MKHFVPNAYKKAIALFLTVLMLFQTGCQYFMVKNISPNELPRISNLENSGNKFAIHYGDDVFLLNNIAVDSTNMSGNLAAGEGLFYYKYRSKQYKARTEKSIIHEVHIYLKNNTPKPQIGETKIPLNQIEEIRVIDQDTGATVVSYVFGGIGIALGVFVILTIIILLTKGSCPYVYVNNGETFVFEGETFGGAIAPNLERDDYMPLPSLKSENNEYKINITNELKERQYTDLAQLIVVNHLPNQQVLLDKNGQPQLITQPQQALKANSFNGENLKSSLNKKDQNVFLFNNENYSKNGMHLSFEKRAQTTSAKLVLNAKNTLWFDYLFGDFLSKFGESYNTWMNKQAQMPSNERLQKIIDNDFPLSVYVKKKNGWQLVDYLLTVGPLASRNFVIPIDLTDIPGNEIELKLETGFMFWEVDYAAIDFTNNQTMQTTELNPVSAMGSNSQDWKASLEKTDHKYMAQENVGDVTELTYKTPPTNANQKQTVFLHTRGYYQLIRNFEGLPQITELNKFKTPGYFSQYSRTEYLKTLEKENEIANISSTPY